MTDPNLLRRLYLATAPAALPVTIAEVEAHLKLDDTEDTDRLTRLINSAVVMLDAPRGLLGGAIVTQSWDLKLPRFPNIIEVPFPPLQSIDSITYLDTSGTLQTLSLSLYQVLGLSTGKRAFVVPEYNTYWPDTYDQPEAVTVRFTCGYDVGGSPLVNNVPEPIREAVLTLVEMRHDGVKAADALKEVAALTKGLASDAGR